MTPRCACRIISDVSTGNVLLVETCPICMRYARSAIARALTNIDLQISLALSTSGAEAEAELLL